MIANKKGEHKNMDMLYKLGIPESDVDNMIDFCPNILIMFDEEVEDKINLLKQIGCEESDIIYILIYNPWYLERLDKDVLNLFDTLLKNKFKSINKLIKKNPYILNLDSSEIEQYIINKQSEEVKIEDIIAELEENPSLFNEF